MIQIQQLKLRPDHTPAQLEQKIRHELRLADDSPLRYQILRQSVDAHKRPDIFLVYTVEAAVPDEDRILRRCRKNAKISRSTRVRYQIPCAASEVSRKTGSDAAFSGKDAAGKNTNGKDTAGRPVIIGAGPAGLFCAFLLAKAGKKPVICERGNSVEERSDDVRHFWESGVLDPESNVQFGEGGAGAFSDGKLNSAIKDPAGRVRFVLETFTSFGADPSICYSYKPHVGTDVLAAVIRNMRCEIERLGGTFFFHCRLDQIQKVPPAGAAAGSGTGAVWKLYLKRNDEDLTIQTDTVVLAIGHSARDTYRMLSGTGLKMEAKSFAVGLRVQHPQAWINSAMYGEDCPYDLGAAPYKLACKASDGRGVYSFCMCPGGYVVNASSEQGFLAVNGMSYHDRAGENANSAIVVTVSPEDYTDPSFTSSDADSASYPPALRGIAFQRSLEKKAFEAGGGKLPIQRLEDYEKGIVSALSGRIRPMVKGDFTASNVRDLLPEELSKALCEGMHTFGKNIAGFDDPDVLMCGIESRTSSPVRILRGGSLQADGFPGIYPCGEGAGYAGGITSAAVDGMKVAEMILLQGRQERYENK